MEKWEKIKPGFLFAFSHRKAKIFLIGHYEFRETNLISLGVLIYENSQLRLNRRKVWINYGSIQIHRVFTDQFIKLPNYDSSWKPTSWMALRG